MAHKHSAEQKSVFPTIKGQSNKIFDLQFFPSFKPAWATEQWVKIFSIFVQLSAFRRVIQIFMNLPRVSYRVNLPGVSCDHIFHKISPGLHTPVSQSPWGTYATPGRQLSFLKTFHRPLKGQCHKNKYGFLS